MQHRIFILGAHGRLGMALTREWKKLFGDYSIIPVGRQELPFENPLQALAVFSTYGLQEGDVVINCAALTDVDRCEKEPALAAAINIATPSHLARFAAQHKARFIHLSTDYVFDGKSQEPYQETDLPAPLSHYGKTKLAGEQAVLEASSNHVVARVSWVFGPDRVSFIDQIIQRALQSSTVAAVHDKISSPSYTHDLALWLSLFLTRTFHDFRDEEVAKVDEARQAKKLDDGCMHSSCPSPNSSLTQHPSDFPASAVERNEMFELKPPLPGGIYHLCNSGHCSWRDYGEHALTIAAHYGMPLLTTTVAPLKLAEMKNFVAERPVQTALNTSKFARLFGAPLRPWQEAVEEYVRVSILERFK